ncbi:mitotic-spindle organizing protein 1-like [Portunus trituberculatus]|uniref:mitotic-spindle organizing protein 1-like n=1 Tax=Portunus trituberculatus TaxID=210409 RepID=UPI001E1D18DC|nr:mitotic-spindle organizing protein 1-like [Portunus trituberculatus]XP_045126647.1 mitotic-spindle organizing protein 1-like [Portunus trituberculatus]
MSVPDSSVVTAKETFQILMEMSKLLNTRLDETTLALCVRLCDNGANPESLAKVVNELMRVKNEMNTNTAQGRGSAGT